ncbi:hypothetical protein IPH92_02330 [Candidatus Kaiserbacteria bacterium]|nr:MAG: hypothetical protein IPH92_02330 [Candidatus Kaiserbacteria bacterium]
MHGNLCNGLPFETKPWRTAMHINLFDLLDDYLIDRLFQPICDRVRKIFGWSKRVPVATMKFLMIIGIIPVCVTAIIRDHAFSIFIGVITLLWIMNQSWLIFTLIKDEIHDGKSEGKGGSSILDGWRVIGRGFRKATLLLSVFLFPFVLAGIATPEMSHVSLFYGIGLLANLGDDFFKACTDLPKGKSVFARMKEWFRNHSLRPVPQTS